jgi:hypothetical protein
MMILAGSILLFSSRPKSTSGDVELFSTNMKRANEIIPTKRKPAICIAELIFLVLLVPPVCK